MRYLISLLISNLLIFQSAFATLNNVDKTQIFSKNLLTNGGFESGKAQWTPNDTADFTTSTTTPLEGGVNAEWDADASTDTLTSTAIAIPSGWYGRNGVASCLFVTPSGTATHEIQAYDGSNVLSEATITSSTSPTRTSTNFIFPSSGSISLRIYANADEPNLELDSCFLGPAEGYNVSSVSQATFVGGMENAGASTCSYSQNTSSGASNFVDLGTGTSCAAWTVVSNGPGTISAQGTNDHRLVYTNMPPGNYQFMITGVLGNLSAANASWYFQLSDGTNTYQPQGGGASANAMTQGLLVFHVAVTTAATRTYKLQIADNAAITSGWYNAANNPGSWKIYRFPTSAEQAYTPDLQAMSWSGYHDSTCSWTTTSATPSDPSDDASCALTERTNQNFGSVVTYGAAKPGITFTPKKAGRYFICAMPQAAGSTASTITWKLWDGTTTVGLVNDTSSASGIYMRASVCGIYAASSTSSVSLRLQFATTAGTMTMNSGANSAAVVEWSIFSLDQSLPAPVLTNMVTTPVSGGTRTTTAEINCDSGSSITSNPGSWISTLGNVSGGACVITAVTGTFSAAPHCFLTLKSAALGETYSSSVSVTSATSITVAARAAAGASTAWDGYVQCIGAR